MWCFYFFNSFMVTFRLSTSISIISLSRYTSITASGQIIAQLPQPVHWQLSNSAGKNPFWLDLSDMTIPFFGQAITHKPQPLHRSLSIMIFPAISTQNSIPRRKFCKEKRVDFYSCLLAYIGIYLQMLFEVNFQ